MDRLVVATHNLKKSGEMRALLTQLLPDLAILTLDDFPGAPEPEETGATYEENAAIKSETAARFTKLPCIADDAGLEIDAFEGAPGLHSKRFGGEELPFDQKMSRILDAMKNIPDTARGARFRCCIAFTIPNSQTTFDRTHANIAEHIIQKGTTLVFEATCEGKIAYEPKGSGGFGYDPIFFLPELNRHMAELSPDEKHAISHRGRVLRQFAKFFEAARATSLRRADS